MNCYLCESEAVSRCYTCGELICERHGGENCQRCNCSVVAGDPRPDRITARRPRSAVEGKHGWWRPQQAADFEPPGCYECGGLCRRVCRNCQGRYCPEHAGADHLRAACARSSWLGVVILAGVAVVFGSVLLFGHLFR